MNTANTRLDVTTRGQISSNAGLQLPAELASALNTTSVLDAHLAALVPATVGHSARTVLTGLVLSLIAGDDVSDSTLIRPLFVTSIIDTLPSGPTVHRRIHHLADHAEKSETGNDRAMRTLRTRA